MVLIGEDKKVYQREYMRWRRGILKPGKCEACHRNDYIQAHHEDYSKPTEVIWLCASCHKKTHLIKADKQRQKFNPYKDPLKKLQPKLYNPSKHKIGDRVLVYRGKRLVETVIPELDADGQPIPGYG